MQTLDYVFILFAPVLAIVLFVVTLLFKQAQSKGMTAKMEELGKDMKSMRAVSERVVANQEVLQKNVTQIATIVKNNLHSELQKVLDETVALRPRTNAEKALLHYFNQKIVHVVGFYRLVKDNMVKIFEPAFQGSLLGSGRAELLSYYTYETEAGTSSFPQKMLDFVDEINQEHLAMFLEAIKFQMSIAHEDERVMVLKQEVVRMLRLNIKEIYELYVSTKHLITDPEFLKVYGHSNKAIYQNIVRDKYSEVKHVVEVNDMLLKKLIASNDGKEEAFVQLEKIVGSTSKFKNLITIKSEYRRTREQIVAGTLNNDEANLAMNRITKRMLDLLDMVSFEKEEQSC